MTKYLLIELDRAGRENIWLLVMVHGPRCARSIRHDLKPPHSTFRSIAHPESRIPYPASRRRDLLVVLDIWSVVYSNVAGFRIHEIRAKIGR